ncbi:MAG: hypothetical protein F4X16_03385 [Caldilineaceae bacterium SB0661_bin_34]|nr:hypothetical protein [Caldilineaceae bacterium SB0661_bin_34]
MVVVRKAAKVPFKRALRYRIQGDGAEREHPYSLLMWNRWTEALFLHRRMRKYWRGSRSRVTNRIGADAGSNTAQVWHGWAWLYLQSLECGRRMATPPFSQAGASESQMREPPCLRPKRGSDVSPLGLRDSSEDCRERRSPLIRPCDCRR